MMSLLEKTRKKQTIDDGHDQLFQFGRRKALKEPYPLSANSVYELYHRK